MNKQIYFFKKNEIWGGFNRFTLKTAFSKSKIHLKKELFVNFDFIKEGKEKLNKYEFNPHVFYIVPTLKCNLNCKYCFILNKENKFMSKKTAKTAIDLFLKYYALKSKSKGFILNFYGGEPLLNWDVVKYSINYWCKLIKKIKKGSDINLVTNGLLINKQMGLFFKKHAVRVSISIDGYKETNNENRLNSNYNKIINNYKLLKDMGINVYISFTLNKNNSENLKKEINFLHNNLKPKAIMINIPQPIKNKSYNITENNVIIKKYLEMFTYFKKKGIGDNIFTILLHRFIEQKIGYHHCICSKGQVVVDPYGNIGPCQTFLGNKLFFPGNIFNNYNLKNIDLFNQWVKTGSYSMPDCKDCIGIGLCRGGCRYASYLFYKNIKKKDIRICKHIKYLIKFFIWELYKTMNNSKKDNFKN